MNNDSSTLSNVSSEKPNESTVPSNGETPPEPPPAIRSDRGGRTVSVTGGSYTTDITIKNAKLTIE